MVKEINAEELEQLLESGKQIVCDFWAAWCGPCRMLAPVMETLSEEFEGRAEFVKLDIDAYPEPAMKFNVMSIPNVIVFENGKVKTQSVGYAPESEMRKFFEENL